jgi:branched-subunit amino acid transport protein
MTGLWMTLIAIGLLTFATRLSFILLLGKWKPSELLQRSLRFIPLAVLPALIFPDIFIRDGQVAIPPDMPRLAAAIAAGLVAWRTKNVFLTIGVGLLVFYLLRFFLGT